MKMPFTVIAAFGLAAGSPVLAQADAQDAETSIVVDGTDRSGYDVHGNPITNPAEEGYDPDLIVCRKEKRTSSRTRRRNVCLANSEWQRVAREGNALANRIVEDGRAGSLTN